MSKIRLLCLTIYAFSAALGLHEFFQYVDWAKPLNLAAVRHGGQVSPAERALRPNYPYSVIPGGAYTPDELRRSIDRDKVVRAHYADFDLNLTTTVTLSEDRFQFVSYRINNRVYWTHKKLRIPKGEVLLTDGRHYARTRCGNRLCASLAANTSFTIAPLKKLALPPFTMQLLARNQIELAPPELELPEAPELGFELGHLAPYVPPVPPPPPPIPGWPPLMPGPAPVPSSPGLPIVPVSPLPGPIPVPPPPPISAVPEPASIYLFLTAFGLSLWFITRWLRSERSDLEEADQN
jgi:hypothetical protein